MNPYGCRVFSLIATLYALLATACFYLYPGISDDAAAHDKTDHAFFTIYGPIILACVLIVGGLAAWAFVAGWCQLWSDYRGYRESREKPQDSPFDEL